MKPIISKSILILSVGLFFYSAAKATNFENPKKIEIANTSSLIREHFTFLNVIFNFNQEELVNVVFTIDENAKVNLVIANTKNEKLKSAIETKFKTLTLPGLKANNAYSIDFKFKKQ